MIESIKNNIEKLISWFYRQKARAKLLKSKREDLAVFGVLEIYLTQKIIEGNTARRQELSEMQSRIEETKEFINFIKKTK